MALYIFLMFFYPFVLVILHTYQNGAQGEKLLAAAIYFLCLKSHESLPSIPYFALRLKLSGMRIAVNTRFLLPGRMEGIGRFTDEVARRLVQRHPEHEFLFFFDRPFDPAIIPASNVKPVALFPPARHPLLWFAWFEWAVPQALRRHRADVFFSPDGFCSLRSSVPTVMVTHDLAHVHFPEAVPPLVRAYYRYFVPRYLRHAARIVTVSEFTTGDIQRQFGILPEKIATACNGCDPAFSPLQEEEKRRVRDRYSGGRPYFFYIGAMHPRKNVDRLIGAFDLFKSQTGAPARLLLAGRLAWQTGPVRSAWEAACHRDDIIFAGYVPDEELPRLMGAALALTWVSLFEGFGVPLLEAMHTGTPVLCSDVSSLPEVAGEAALLVDPYSLESIAGGMARLWSDAELRRSLVEKGRAQRLKYSWDRATEVVYDSIISCSI